MHFIFMFISTFKNYAKIVHEEQGFSSSKTIMHSCNLSSIVANNEKITMYLYELCFLINLISINNFIILLKHNYLLYDYKMYKIKKE